jgi:ABC-2 type transport system ATP-binding protein
MPAVSVQSLHKTYPGTRKSPPVEAVKGISFEVETGEFFGLLGPNGAGKSTLIRMLNTLLPPTSGRALVMGHDVATNTNEVRGEIGVIPQANTVDGDLTAWESLDLYARFYGMGRRERQERARELLQAVGLWDWRDKIAGTYSGGMRRRLDLAAALVHRPPVLFLDEPTTGLDPQSRVGVWELIGELVADGATVLLTTQYLEEADRLADRIVVVDYGRVIAEGTAKELKSSFGSTVIEIGFPNAAGALRACAVLTRLAVRPPEQIDAMLRVPVADGPRVLMEALRILDADGLTPTTLVVREPSLDDVFLTLTGRRAESGQPEPETTRGAA